MRTILILLHLFCSMGLFAQSLQVSYFDLKNGLPSKECHDIHQCRNGLIFIATDEGIASFDGHKFSQIILDNEEPNIGVYKIFEIEDELWFTTSSNKLYYLKNSDFPNYKIRAYRFNTLLSNSAQSNVIKVIKKTNDELYVSFDEEVGYLKINSKGMLTNEIISDQDKQTPAELFAINVLLKNDDFPFYYANRSDYKQTNSNFKLSFDRENTKYYRLSKRKDELLIITGPKLHYYRAQKLIYTVELHSTGINCGFTQSGNIWVGTKFNGLYLINKQSRQSQHLLQNLSVTDYIEDMDGNHWFTTLEKGLLKVENLELRVYFTNQNVEPVNLSIIAQDEIVVDFMNGTSYQLPELKMKFNFDTPHQILFREYHSNGNLSKILFNNSYVSELNTNSSLSHYIQKLADNINAPPLMIGKRNAIIFLNNTEFKRVFFDDKVVDAEWKNDSLIWVACSDKVYEYNARNQSSRLLFKEIKGTIVDLDFIDAQSFICITKSSGIFFYSRNNLSKFISKYKAKYYEVFVESSNHFWIGTNSGIVEIDKSNQRIQSMRHVFSTNNEQNLVKDLVVLKNELWFCSDSKIYSIPKSSLKQENNALVRAYIKSIKIDNNLISKQTALKSSSKDLQLVLDYIYFGKKEVSFRYKLIGIHTQWVDMPSNSLSISNLSPGKYSIEIETLLDNEVQSKIVHFDFEIPFPWYRETWFYMLLLILIVAAIILSIKLKLIHHMSKKWNNLKSFVKRKLLEPKFTFTIRMDGQQKLINSEEVLFLKTDGNYIEIQTATKKFIYRGSMASLLEKIPDNSSYIQVHRSFAIRKDKVTSKSKKRLLVENHEIPVGVSYQNKIFNEINF